jgi:hypothetical protein
MSSFNDLIGLTREWAALPNAETGKADCCLLAAEVHKRLGYFDYTPELLAIFAEYTDDTWPKSIIPRWLLKNATPIPDQRPHAVVLLQGQNGGAMGTVLAPADILYIGLHGVIRAPIPADGGRYFWLNK